MHRMLVLGICCLSLVFVVACANEEVSGPTALRSGIDFDGFDTTARPQDDFNGYVNGKWIEETDIPEDQGEWGSFRILRKESDERQRAIIEELAARTDLTPGTDEQRIGDFFSSYMDEERAEQLGADPLRSDIETILSAQSSAQLLAEGGRLRRYGLNSPLSMFIGQDLGDSTRYTAYFNQAGLSLPDRDYYFNEDQKFATIREGLANYAQSLFDLAGIGDAGDRGRAVLEIETQIAGRHWEAEDTRDAERTYNRYAVEDLDAVTNRFDWERYLRAIGLDGETEVVVRMPSYVEGLGELLESIALEDWRSYYVYGLLDRNAALLSDAFVQANFGFHGRLVNGREELLPRWRRATQLINGLIGEAVGRVYVERHFSPGSKARMEALVQNLIEAFGEAIEGLEWMTDDTKVSAQAKRDKFTYKIGYPDQWRDYSELAVAADDLLGNVWRGRAFEYDRNLGRLGGPVDRGEWYMTPQTVNAYHNANMNEIVFPAAILQPPFFDMGADDAVNYGGIGAVIGHEIGHAFDDQGRKFDGDGNLRDWWSDIDAAAFQERADRLIAHYAAFEPVAGLHVNGELTLGENIGDLTGLTLAYRAYLKSLNGQEAPVIDGLSGAERFFIGYAQIWRTKTRDETLRSNLLSDPHSPAAVRVNGPLVHVPAFYETFGVTEGDAMWLPVEDRVQVW